MKAVSSRWSAYSTMYGVSEADVFDEQKLVCGDALKGQGKRYKLEMRVGGLGGCT